MALTNQYQSLACRHLNWNVHPASQVGFASCLDCGRDVSLAILFNDLKARMEVAMRGNDSFGYATGEKCGAGSEKTMNIDQLPAGRELDALIAEKAMGLRPCVYHQCGSFSAWATMWKCECGKPSECFPGNKEAIEHLHSMLPRYSTDIAAAWTVVEKLRDQFIEICQTGADSMGKWTKWQCEFDAVDGEAVADTISLAICRAALKAVKP